MATSSRVVLFAVLVGLAVGCAKESNRVPVYPAGGALLHNGKAAVGAIVILHPADPAAAPVKPRGKVGPDGSYRLTTYDTGDGAPAGDYAVSIYWPKPPPPGEPNNDDGPDILGGKYLRPESPVARVSITPGENVLAPITLK
ncbi:MAG TPA: hypothetical protein VM529_18250 [Gemmata sp.]|nr:hypothetical protein [Gemmata sp.]